MSELKINGEAYDAEFIDLANNVQIAFIHGESAYKVERLLNGTVDLEFTDNGETKEYTGYVLTGIATLFAQPKDFWTGKRVCAVLGKEAV